MTGARTAGALLPGAAGWLVLHQGGGQARPGPGPGRGAETVVAGAWRRAPEGTKWPANCEGGFREGKRAGRLLWRSFPRKPRSSPSPQFPPGAVHPWEAPPGWAGRAGAGEGRAAPSPGRRRTGKPPGPGRRPPAAPRGGGSGLSPAPHLPVPGLSRRRRREGPAPRPASGTTWPPRPRPARGGRRAGGDRCPGGAGRGGAGRRRSPEPPAARHPPQRHPLSAAPSPPLRAMAPRARRRRPLSSLLALCALLGSLQVRRLPVGSWGSPGRGGFERTRRPDGATSAEACGQRRQQVGEAVTRVAPWREGKGE